MRSRTLLALATTVAALTTTLTATPATALTFDTYEGEVTKHLTTAIPTLQTGSEAAQCMDAYLEKTPGVATSVLQWQCNVTTVSKAVVRARAKATDSADILLNRFTDRLTAADHLAVEVYTVGDKKWVTIASAHDLDPDAPPRNRAPKPSFTYTRTDDSFVFDAAASFDHDGQIVSYEWATGPRGAEVSLAAGVTAPWTAPGPGVYRIVLTVTDDVGASRTRALSLSIMNPDDITPFARKLVDRVNAARTARGRVPVTTDPCLTKAARRHARAWPPPASCSIRTCTR